MRGAIMSGTVGVPLGSVPVLSRTTTSTLCAVSRASALRIRMPFSAPLPVPTMIAVGVASPIAQGHAIISTATAVSMAYRYVGSGPNTNQIPKTPAATRMTTGTK